MSKGANLTVFCILSQLEKFKRRNGGNYPETLYVQVDGGSENANSTLLATLELLVAKRIIKTIVMTRLPVGHTHADIDAVFGVIWSIFRGEPCLTLQQYKSMIEDVLKGTKLKCTVEDVMVIPDYNFLFDGCVDPKLSSLHKLDHTQLQWRFDAVTRCWQFPNGVKTVYRAYSSDRVVELIEKPKAQCLTSIGSFTGLEPVTTIVRWYPTKDCDKIRCVEGFYLLVKLPDFKRKTLQPMSFPEGCAAAIADTVKSVYKKYNSIDPNHIIVRDSWNDWSQMYAPQNDDANEYVSMLRRKKKPYDEPLKLALYDKEFRIVSNSWNYSISYRALDEKFEWPEVLAATMHSVAHSMNLNPPNPRMYTSSDVELERKLLRFHEETATAAYYSEAAFTVEKIKRQLNRQISYQGSKPSLTGIFLKLVFKFFFYLMYRFQKCAVKKASA